jgi:hypothetical protein
MVFLSLKSPTVRAVITTRSYCFVVTSIAPSYSRSVSLSGVMGFYVPLTIEGARQIGRICYLWFRFLFHSI